MDKTGYGIAEETKAGLDQGIEQTLSYIRKKWPKDVDLSFMFH